MHKLYKFKFSVVDCSTQHAIEHFEVDEDSFFSALEKARNFPHTSGHEVRYCGATVNE